MKVYSIYALNKAGGLIYQRDLNSGLNRLNANDYLVLAGTLHGAHAIASKLTPSEYTNKIDTVQTSSSSRNYQLLSSGKSQNSNCNTSGLQSLETDFFNLYLFQTLTGIKFIIITSPNPIVHNFQPVSHTVQPAIYKGELCKQYEAVSSIFKKLYVLYSDYVMKDPFYSLDMPIKNTVFDERVGELSSF